MPFVPNPTSPIFTRTPLEGACDGVRQGTVSSIFSSDAGFFWSAVTLEEGVESGLAFPDGMIGDPLIANPPRVGLVSLVKVGLTTFLS
jgi:hypothetical protein